MGAGAGWTAGESSPRFATPQGEDAADTGFHNPVRGVRAALLGLPQAFTARQVTDITAPSRDSLVMPHLSSSVWAWSDAICATEEA